MRGMGSGFIVSPDGYILTNAHVVSAASEVTVKLIDRREFSAKVIGIDARSDLAVLKIDADQLPVVKFGDPQQLKPGQWVVAIGAPFGFENSVTVGVVSGMARSLPGNEYVPFIQTDVAVNPGNSGLRVGIKGGGRAVALLIQRGEAQIFIPVPTAGSP